MSEAATTIGDGPIGFIGVGHMGSSLVTSALRAGLRIKVFDVRQEAVKPLVAAGVEAVASIADLARDCSMIAVVVMNDDQVWSVAQAIFDAPTLPHVIVVQSTVTPGTITHLATIGAERGVSVIDAAISGGHEKASRGMLTLLIGGPDEPVEFCQPYFAAVAESIFHIGPAGSGTAIKLVNNLLVTAGYALQLEAVALAAAYGISEETFATAVSLSSGASHNVWTWGRLDRLRREHTLAGTPGIYEFMTKDMNDSVFAAGERDLTLPLTALAAELLPAMLAARDEVLASRGAAAAIPFCIVCGQELAPPFQLTGLHPECRPFEAGTSEG
jgi:3-hydroxyisobutyrate dehydrogenase-like beta-hydroxyacid dehydrogenase